LLAALCGQCYLARGFDRSIANTEVAMLVLTRRQGERICIGNDIVVTVVQLGQGKVRIGIEAPPEAVVLREELVNRSAGAPVPMLLDGAVGGAAIVHANPAAPVGEK
jgi:carbon storage regulator